MKKFLKLIFYNLLTFSGFFVLFLIALELILRNKTLLDETDNPRPSYYPSYMNVIDKENESDGNIDQWGFRSADGHDKLLKLKNSQGANCNIVILGDSFVWGDGLKIGERWVDKLDQKTDCTIHSFGKGGWSSLQQFEFYNYRLKNLKFDHLIIGYVMNDPYLGNTLDNQFLDIPKGEESIFKRFKNRIRLINSHTDLRGFNTELKILDVNNKTKFYKQLEKNSNLMNRFVDFSERYNIQSVSYLNYKLNNFINRFLPEFVVLNSENEYQPKQVLALKPSGKDNYLYNQEYLKYWEEALLLFMQNKNHKISFVITSTHKSKHLPKLYKLFAKHDFNLTDCTISYPEGRPRAEWANLFDSHPGKDENEFFAQCINKNVIQNLDIKK